MAIPEPIHDEGKSSDVMYLDADRWRCLFAFLSLDAVRPWLGAMGLELPGERERELIVLLRHRIGEAISATLHNAGTRMKLVSETLKAAAATCGEDVCLQLLNFGRLQFTLARTDHPEIFAWHDLFERYRKDRASLGSLLPPEDLDSKLDTELWRVHDRSFYPTMFRLPLSSWDLIMCAVHQIDDADEQSPEHPLRLIQETVLVTRYRIFWQALVQHLGDMRTDDFHWNATRLAWEFGTLPRDEMLAHPASLFENAHV